MRTVGTAIVMAFAATSSAWAQETPAPIIRQVVVIGAKGLSQSQVAEVALAAALGRPGDAQTLQAVADAVAEGFLRRVVQLGGHGGS